MGLQSCKRPNFRNFRTPNLEVPGQKKHKKYYKGEGGGSPQVHAMVSFVSSCTKRALIMH
jgi:carbamate kinase